jgi:hypothetical protein
VVEVLSRELKTKQHDLDRVEGKVISTGFGKNFESMYFAEPLAI